MPAPLLLVMGALDVLGGSIMLGLPEKASVSLLGLGFSETAAFYLGFALLVKGVYSLFWGIVGSDA